MIFIQKPAELVSLFVNIPLSLKGSDYKCIVPVQIPNPTDSNFEDVVRVQQYFTDNPACEIIMAPVTFEFDLRYKNPYSKTWEEIISQVNK